MEKPRRIMKYIKDTDFLPIVKNVSQDVYRLTYGIAKIRNERKIYDIIVFMCRAYPDTPLRRAKITAWKSAVSETMERLGAFSSTQGEVVYIPYFEAVCSPEGLYSLYRFALGVLNELYSLDRIPDYRRGTSRESIQLFFPIGNLVDIIQEFGRKYKNNNQLDKEIEAIIDNELIKRGLLAEPTRKTKKSFDELFYDSGNHPAIDVVEKKSDDKDDIAVSWYSSTYFLYLALQECVANAWDRKKTREDTLRDAANATYRIASGLFKPEEPLNHTIRNTSDNTFYTYMKNIKKDKPDSDSRKEAEQRVHDFLRGK